MGGTGDEAARFDLVPGARVGKYEITRRLGEGGMATIYLASSAGPGGFAKPCALKLLRPELAERESIARMLATEARIAALLSHPNIVQVFDFGTHGHSYFMTMEWVDGVSLGHLLARLMRERRRLPVSVAVHIALHVAEALAYLADGVEIDGKKASLVHRDVSPSNVLLSSLGAVKLTDFGIVKVLEAPTHTRVGVVKGKYAYMAPEQLRGDPVDHRADLFSLGVVLFELLTMARLFHRKNIAATIAAVHAARVPPPSSLWPDIPPQLDAIVAKLLSKRREDRYASAADVGEELVPFTAAGARAELTAEVRAAMSSERAALHRALFTPSNEPEDDVLPAVSAAEFEALEALDDIDEIAAEEDDEVPSPPPLPLARPSRAPRSASAPEVSGVDEPTAPRTAVSSPPVPFAMSQAPMPATPAPRAAGMSGSGAALPSSMSTTLPPATTAFPTRAPAQHHGLAAVIVGLAVIGTIAFWWLLLS